LLNYTKLESPRASKLLLFDGCEMHNASRQHQRLTSVLAEQPQIQWLAAHVAL
jgi:hypothetical protein